MCHLRLLSCVLASLLYGLWTVAASAQTIYRCGNSYSQTPCSGGHTLAIDDSRTAAQKSQTDAATVQTRQLAAQLERERVAQEKAAMAAGLRQDAGHGRDKTRNTAGLAAQSDTADAGKKPRARHKQSGTELELYAAPLTPDKKTSAAMGTAKGR
jgi:CDGSH-type Zn-finger protein